MTRNSTSQDSRQAAYESARADVSAWCNDHTPKVMGITNRNGTSGALRESEAALHAFGTDQIEFVLGLIPNLAQAHFREHERDINAITASISTFYRECLGEHSLPLGAIDLATRGQQRALSMRSKTQATMTHQQQVANRERTIRGLVQTQYDEYYAKPDNWRFARLRRWLNDSRLGCVLQIVWWAFVTLGSALAILKQIASGYTK